MDLHRIKTEHVHNALRFLLHRMGAETRLELMGELPTAYAELYPMVDQAHILRAVSGRLNGHNGEA